MWWCRVLSTSESEQRCAICLVVAWCTRSGVLIKLIVSTTYWCLVSASTSLCVFETSEDSNTSALDTTIFSWFCCSQDKKIPKFGHIWHHRRNKSCWKLAHSCDVVRDWIIRKKKTTFANVFYVFYWFFLKPGFCQWISKLVQFISLVLMCNGSCWNRLSFLLVLWEILGLRSSHFLWLFLP
jgi:hypothetical protein